MEKKIGNKMGINGPHAWITCTVPIKTHWGWPCFKTLPERRKIPGHLRGVVVGLCEKKQKRAEKGGLKTGNSKVARRPQKAFRGGLLYAPKENGGKKRREPKRTGSSEKKKKRATALMQGRGPHGYQGKGGGEIQRDDGPSRKRSKRQGRSEIAYRKRATLQGKNPKRSRKFGVKWGQSDRGRSAKKKARLPGQRIRYLVTFRT